MSTLSARLLTAPLTRFGLLLALSAAALAGPARCQTLVTARAALVGSDRVDWAVLGDDAYPLSDPFRIGSAAGLSVAVSESGHGLSNRYGGAFGTIRQAGSPLGEGTLNGNFAPGDIALYVMDGGVVSLSFPHGVYGGGAQLAAPIPTPSGEGAFTVQVRAFGRDGALLGSWTRGGTFSAKGDNSAPFFGIVDAAPDIYRLSYTAVSPHYGFFLNRFDIATRPAAPPPSHTHLLWNNTDGRVMLWSVAADGSFTLHGYGPYTGDAPPAPKPALKPSVLPPPVIIPPQNKWTATALATGPDGLSHVLWNGTDGRALLWTVGDDGSFTSATYGPYVDDAPDHKWSATAVSVGPDNVTHLLWNNTDRRVMLWSVQPDFSFTLAGYGPYSDDVPQHTWSASGVATGPDNVTRLVWNNTDGRVMLWDVQPDFSFTLAGYGPYTDDAPDHKWSAVGVSVGPDNVTHLLWSNTNRRAMFWNVKPDFSFTLAGYGPYVDQAPDQLWSAAGVATGPDGLSHLLWGNTDRRAMLWGVDPAFGFTVAGYGPYTDDAPDHKWSVTAVSAGP